MVLDIMSAPQLPARRPSQKGRPLPATPDNPSHFPTHQPSVRALPPTPEQNVISSPPSRVRQTNQSVHVPNSLNTSGQTLNKRPLPPPPVEGGHIVSPVTQNEQNTVSRRGLPPVPNESSPVGSQSGTLKRPLPPPPTTETTPPIPPNTRPSSKQTANGNTPIRSTNHPTRSTNHPTRSANQLDIPPQLPARKPSVHSTHTHGSAEEDLETRFRFHDVKDFPPPDEYQGQEKKYPSQSQTNIQHGRRKRTSPR